MNDNNFFSIDRLVEFGLGVSMAQQMVNVMNQSMKSMYVPGSIQSMPAKPEPVSNIYYVAPERKPMGPLNDTEITKLILLGKIDKDTLAWMPGMSNWKAIADIPEILKLVALTPPQLPVN